MFQTKPRRKSFQDHLRITNINAGITLIEILVAIIVFSVALLGISQVMISTININMFANNLTTATTLAQDKLEDIHRLGYANVNTGLFFIDSDTAVGTEDYNTITDFESYKRVITVNNNVPTTGMKTVEITVFWKDDSRSTSLNTVIAE